MRLRQINWHLARAHWMSLKNGAVKLIYGWVIICSSVLRSTQLYVHVYLLKAKEHSRWPWVYASIGFYFWELQQCKNFYFLLRAGLRNCLLSLIAETVKQNKCFSRHTSPGAGSRTCLFVCLFPVLAFSTSNKHRGSKKIVSNDASLR